MNYFTQKNNKKEKGLRHCVVQFSKTTIGVISNLIKDADVILDLLNPHKSDIGSQVACNTMAVTG